jgi:hypothetical protein
MRMRAAEASVLGDSAVSNTRCAACGRDNDRRRELCRVCGADLETGLALEPTATRPRRRTRSRSDRRERIALLVLGVVVVAVAVVGPLMLLGLGPFAPTERLAPALLLRAAYPGDPVALTVATVATTTTATLPDRDLSSLNLIDGDGASAWIGLPLEGDAAGEVIQLVLEKPAWVVRIQFRNGDQLSPAAYESSERLQRGVLSFDGGRDYRIDLLDIGQQTQVLELPEPELTTRITIRVDRTFAGIGPRGVAISEVTPIGWSADAADAALARQRAQW